MKGYKVFNPDWSCREMQYKVGTSYEMDDKPEEDKQVILSLPNFDADIFEQCTGIRV